MLTGTFAPWSVGLLSILIGILITATGVLTASADIVLVLSSPSRITVRFVYFPSQRVLYARWLPNFHQKHRRLLDGIDPPTCRAHCHPRPYETFSILNTAECTDTRRKRLDVAVFLLVIGFVRTDGHRKNLSINPFRPVACRRWITVRSDIWIRVHIKLRSAENPIYFREMLIFLHKEIKNTVSVRSQTFDIVEDRQVIAPVSDVSEERYRQTRNSGCLKLKIALNVVLVDGAALIVKSADTVPFAGP